MAHPKGGYKLDGERVPGTTTITGRFADKGGLMYWAFNQGKLAEKGEIESLYDKRDEAAESGTLAHAMIESHIKGIDWHDHEDVTGQESDEVIKQAKKGYKNALNWLEQSRIEIVLTEPQLISKEHRFGGSPDAIGKDTEGRYCLLDWKTSSGLYPDYLVQVGGGYVLLCDECLPEYPITGGIHICRFSKEFGDFHHHYFDDLPEAREQFLLFRQAYENDKLLKRRAK